MMGVKKSLFLLKRKSGAVLCLVMSDSFQPYGLQPARLLCPWDSPGKNTGLGCCALLQGILKKEVSEFMALGQVQCAAILLGVTSSI